MTLSNATVCTKGYMNESGHFSGGPDAASDAEVETKKNCLFICSSYVVVFFWSWFWWV